MGNEVTRLPVYGEGEEPAWYAWYRARRIPIDWQTTCCLCGKRGHPSDEMLRQITRTAARGRIFTPLGIALDLLMDQASDSVGAALFPYHPVLVDGAEARDIARWFGTRRLKACTDCRAPSMDDLCGTPYPSDPLTFALRQFLERDDDADE